MAMAEMGCEHATIPEAIILQLSLLDAEANPPPGTDSTEESGYPRARLAHLAKTDVLAEGDWDGKLPPADVDYLADNGAFLTSLIEADPVTKEGLHLALEAFKDNENQSRAAIEEVLKQV